MRTLFLSYGLWFWISNLVQDEDFSRFLPPPKRSRVDPAARVVHTRHSCSCSDLIFSVRSLMRDLYWKIVQSLRKIFSFLYNMGNHFEDLMIFYIYWSRVICLNYKNNKVGVSNVIKHIYYKTFIIIWEQLLFDTISISSSAKLLHFLYNISIYLRCEWVFHQWLMIFIIQSYFICSWVNFFKLKKIYIILLFKYLTSEKLNLHSMPSRLRKFKYVILAFDKLVFCKIYMRSHDLPSFLIYYILNSFFLDFNSYCKLLIIIVVRCSKRSNHFWKIL